MSIVAEISSVVGPTTRRTFLKGMGVTGISVLGSTASTAMISVAAKCCADSAGKKITLLNDGGFETSAWGWQFTAGAQVVDHSRRKGHRAVQVKTYSGDYARFLVLEPEVGKKYTLSGWVKTQMIREKEELAGAYFAASQFEFQGRPTEFTVDGKQLPEKRFGNFTGSMQWRRFSQTFTCLPSTTWFEVVVGIYRAEGTAWFSELTFVEGEEAADLGDVVDVSQALQWAHEESLKNSVKYRSRNTHAAAIFRDAIPVRGAASNPEQIAKVLGEMYDVTFLAADQIADQSELNPLRFDLLVLPYGESFPLLARDSVERFLTEGGNLLSMGGYAFQSPLVRNGAGWQFYDDVVQHEAGPNLISALNPRGAGWSITGKNYTSTEMVQLPKLGPQEAIKIEIPRDVWGRNAAWHYELPATGDGTQFFFQAWIRASDVKPAPDGSAYIGIEQLDDKGASIYGPSVILEEIRDSQNWHDLGRLIYLAPNCLTLRVSLGLKNATGTLWGTRISLEHRLPTVRINTARGFPQDELQTNSRQIGMFDADFHLKRATTLRAAAGQCVVQDIGELKGSFQGYAATCVLGMNKSRRIPLLEALDQLGRKRGAAGALVHHIRGVYARGSWAFFGIENQDIFASGMQFGERTLRAVGHALISKCFLHACETEFASYRVGETVRVRVFISNYGRNPASLAVRCGITPVDTDRESFGETRRLKLAPGQTVVNEFEWHPVDFSDKQYRVMATLSLANSDSDIDRIETGFIIWKPETLQEGLPFKFEDNYFQVHGRSVFLQGTDDYLHTFIDQDENQLTWYGDARGCRDSCLDVYENLMGLRGPMDRPTETWWRWVDAMLLGVQRAGGAFFPGMLVFANTAVCNRDLADQKAYVRAFADRYKTVPGIMYYLNGDLELHDPNLPDLQKLYNQYLRKKYGSDEALQKAWMVTPPEAPIGQLAIRSGTDDWRDVRTLDDFEFRTQVVRRWLNALHDSIREVDEQHPVTAEFYQIPTSGIDMPSALGQLELANFGYFNPPGEDYYRFPQVCKFLDQSIRGKGINVGEFGVKTHPAWRDSSDYLVSRSESYEQSYFLTIAHYAFALGVSKIQNWCWKYPSDLPFEWGINYSNELIPRDVRAFYRNSGLLFRRLRPRYENSEVLVLLAGNNRKGGKGIHVVDGEMNGIRLLLDQRLRFGTLADDFIDSLPENVKTIFYPLSYCPNDKIIKRLIDFVDQGGQLYLSGDLSYDSQRQRTRTDRLKDLCGLEFVTERFPNLDYGGGALQTAPKDSNWPSYLAAPGIVTRLVGATLLLEGKDGTPIVTEFKRGKGLVIFSADPIELHGDPRYHAYAHSFYRALLEKFHLAGERIGPEQASVHCFRVPSQDDREIKVLVNYDEAHTLRDAVVSTVVGDVRLTLQPRFPGAIVSELGNGVQAVESSGDVIIANQLLIGGDLHFMAISFDKSSLLTTRRLLLLPMGEGEIRIPKSRRWHRPVVLVGEVAGSRWAQYESFRPHDSDNTLTLQIHAPRALSMLILCEFDEQSEAIGKIETWVSAPWLLDD